MINKLNTTDVNLSLATPEEVVVAYHLANDDTVRSNSFTPNKIPYPTHCAWYENILKDPNALVLHAFVDSKFSGQVKFNIIGEDALIGVSIKPDFRGCGLGTILLQKGINLLYAKNPKIKQVIALIKKENIASVKLFEKVGFIYSEMTTEKGFAAYKYIYKIS